MNASQLVAKLLISIQAIHSFLSPGLPFLRLPSRQLLHHRQEALPSPEQLHKVLKIVGKKGVKPGLVKLTSDGSAHER